ncbi:hypothetical protein IWW36_002184 [Coemansia brasiliensis]|uniref:Uncharacterized protein n=1 Tax=Coemansia brasiliensis TaxID=2650707 RepID=A0A9W8M1A1_9FUNG|nr:hypothetical protein IWW36_002184 [Coemansia brasiliensis]
MSLLIALLAILSLCTADIVLSVATPAVTSDYLDLLSNAWPTVNSKLASELRVAQSQAPAEYSFLLDLLKIDGSVPSQFDPDWALSFISNAEAVGPTTIVAQNIPGASNDPAAQPTHLLTTNDEGDVGVLEDVSMEPPTIIVAINGDAGRLAHDAQSSAADSESSLDGIDGDTTSSQPQLHPSVTAATLLGTAVIALLF